MHTPMNGSAAPRNPAPITQKTPGRLYWRASVTLLVWGQVLLFLDLKFFGLTYILPTLGLLLLFKATRDMEEANQDLNTAYRILQVWMGYHLLFLTLTAMPLGQEPFAVAGMAVVVTLIKFLYLFWLRRGLVKVFASQDKTPGRDPLKWLMVLHWAMAALAALSMLVLALDLLAIVTLAVFICLMVSLSRLGGEMADFPPLTPHHRRTLPLAWVFGGLCLLAVVFTCLLVNHPRLHGEALQLQEPAESWTALEQAGYSTALGAALEGETLEDVGTEGGNPLPREILEILPPEVTETLSQAICVSANVARHGFGPQGENGDPITTVTLYFEYPNNEMRVLFYFDLGQERAFWRDSFALQTGQAFTFERVEGGLAYEKRGQSYAAPFPSLTYGSIPEGGFWGSGTSSQQALVGTFGFPLGAENQRGYALFRLNPVYPAQETWEYVLINYYHMDFPLQMPYQDAGQRLVKGGFFSHFQHGGEFLAHGYPTTIETEPTP